jgi:hypothetical protein
MVQYKFNKLLFLLLLSGTVMQTVSAALSDHSESIMQWRQFQQQSEFGQDPPPRFEFPFNNCFQESSTKHEVPLSMLLAVARGESDFDPQAGINIKNHNALGVMQILWPGTAKDLGFSEKKELLEPCNNIDAGARYLAWLMKRYNGNIWRSIAAYNYGPGNIKTKGDVPQGAKEYANYIYHHLLYVTGGKERKKISTENIDIYRKAQKYPLISYYRSERALRFIEYVRKRDPRIKLEWFKTVLGEYYVVLLYETEVEKDDGVERIKQVVPIELPGNESFTY